MINNIKIKLTNRLATFSQESDLQIKLFIIPKNRLATIKLYNTCANIYNTCAKKPAKHWIIILTICWLKNDVKFLLNIVNNLFEDKISDFFTD